MPAIWHSEKRQNRKMKKSISLIIFISLCISFALCISCKNSKSKKLPEVLINDTIVDVYEYTVTDTFDNGGVRRIRFHDKNDISKPTYEKRYYKSGNICMEGPLDSDSLRDGRWTAWYDCGKIWSIGDYKHGLRHGENKVYYVNGQVEYNKKYVNDTAEGIWTFYLEDGTEILKVFYEKGVVVEQVQLISADSLRNLSAQPIE